MGAYKTETKEAVNHIREAYNIWRRKHWSFVILFQTVIPFMTHGGWPGHVIKDIQNCCAGAKFLPDMKI
jgi:hypothetical protein